MSSASTSGTSKGVQVETNKCLGNIESSEKMSGDGSDGNIADDSKSNRARKSSSKGANGEASSTSEDNHPDLTRSTRSKQAVAVHPPQMMKYGGKKRRFKGGTYQLSIRPRLKKKKVSKIGDGQDVVSDQSSSTTTESRNASEEVIQSSEDDMPTLEPMNTSAPSLTTENSSEENVQKLASSNDTRKAIDPQPEKHVLKPCVTNEQNVPVNSEPFVNDPERKDSTTGEIKFESRNETGGGVSPVEVNNLSLSPIKIEVNNSMVSDQPVEDNTVNGDKKDTGAVSTINTRYSLKQKRLQINDVDSTDSPDQKSFRKKEQDLRIEVSRNPDQKSSFPRDPESIVVRPDMQQKLWIQLCTCREESTNFIENHIQKEIYCQAVDCIDDRLIGCCNIVTKPFLNRPARKIAFVAMCDVHRHRLRAHHCCPGCGLFCSQGTFMQCRPNENSVVHLFHERCCRVLDGEALCPHCGSSSQWTHVRLRVNSSRPPAFSVKQQPVSTEPSARMSLTSCSGVNVPLSSWGKPSGIKPYRLSETGQEITSDGLVYGPDCAKLDSLLRELETIERPINLRYNQKSLYNASKSGEIEKILQMLAIGFDPNHKYEEHDNQTALHAAAISGSMLTVHVLLQSGCAIDMLDDQLCTPLMLAAENRHSEIVHYLIGAGADLEARSDDGMTVLHLAAKSGNFEACRLLVESGRVNLNLLDEGGWTPLVWSAEFSNEAIARLLLEAGSDPNLRDNEQNIALHWAAYSGSLQICELFLNAGCDVNSINEHGDTPLHIACRQDKYECVLLLLARNAVIDIQNNESETSAMCCVDKKSATWIAVDINRQLKKFAKQRKSRTEVILHKDVSQGKEAYPIQCINGADDEPFPMDYLYVIQNCETVPINIDRCITSLQNCSCIDGCSSQSCTCSSLSFKCWFTKEGGLVPEFNLMDPPMIFECNRACRCWKNCSNRVVQHGITCRLQLFRISGKGWGVRTLRDIPRGTFICEYIGELISDSEADQREDDSYLFDLDNKDGETYCIDARHYGNISRFINHSCEPNLVPVKVFVDHQDLRFPRIAFFSSREIKAYEELGFDYGEKFWIIKYKAFTCMCNTPKCKYNAEKIQEMLENYQKRQQDDMDISGTKQIS